MRCGWLQYIFLIYNAIFFTAINADAQIIPDATLPTSSTVRLQDNTQFIEGGTRAGSNLFHSFSEFSVPSDSAAFFNNSLDVQNILTRVTSNARSDINGLIKALGNANLFLMNPNGIIFGQNARLDIGGSFIATGADRMIFGDGSEFSSSKPQEKPLLTVSAPVGLVMGSNAGEIKVLGSGSGIIYTDIKKQPRPRVESDVTGFTVKPEKTLAFVGNNVSFEGAVVKAPAGRVEVGSVGSGTKVSLIPVTEGWKLGYDTVSSFTDISMSRQPFVSATGVGGGSLTLRGRDINLTGESILIADTLDNRDGGEISIIGNSITLDKADASNNTFGTGNAGKITLEAKDTIKFVNGGGVGNHTSAGGNAGEVFLSANSILISNNSGAGSNTYANATGNGGRVFIKANSLLQIENNAGFGTTSYGMGNAGEISIISGRFEIRNGGGMGTGVEGSGNGGKINITANSLLIEDSSGFSTRTLKDATGKAGQIDINVKDSMIIRDSVGMDSNTEGAGDAGEINVNTNSLLIEKTSGINTKAFGTGQAGNIRINANTIRLNDNGALNAETQSVNTDPTKPQANISIKSQNLILRRQGKITVNATGRNVIGGNININTEVLAILENSSISANSLDSSGGKVTIDTQAIFGTQSWYSDVQRGNITATGANPQLNGIIQITTPDIDPGKGLVPLNANTVDVARLVDDNVCVRTADSRFTIIGRGGIASSPNNKLNSDTSWEDWRLSEVDKQQVEQKNEVTSNPSLTSSPTPVVEAQEWIVNNSGDLELVADASNTRALNFGSLSTRC